MATDETTQTLDGQGFEHRVPLSERKDRRGRSIRAAFARIERERDLGVSAHATWDILHQPHTDPSVEACRRFLARYARLCTREFLWHRFLDEGDDAFQEAVTLAREAREAVAPLLVAQHGTADLVVGSARAHSGFQAVELIANELLRVAAGFDPNDIDDDHRPTVAEGHEDKREPNEPPCRAELRDDNSLLIEPTPVLWTPSIAIDDETILETYAECCRTTPGKALHETRATKQLNTPTSKENIDAPLWTFGGLSPRAFCIAVMIERRPDRPFRSYKDLTNAINEEVDLVRFYHGHGRTIGFTNIKKMGSALARDGLLEGTDQDQPLALTRRAREALTLSVKHWRLAV